MKIRNGFVSNSSVSSFICNICGEEFTGQDACPRDFDCCSCENEHIMCNKHLEEENITIPPLKGCQHEFDRNTAKFCPECGEEAWIEYDTGDTIPIECCPICQFKYYDDNEMAKYLEKTRSVSRAEVFAKVKAINKRRRKLYDSEYITDICQRFSLTDDILLKEVKDKFVTFDKYAEFLRSK